MIVLRSLRFSTMSSVKLPQRFPASAMLLPSNEIGSLANGISASLGEASIERRGASARPSKAIECDCRNAAGSTRTSGRPNLPALPEKLNLQPRPESSSFPLAKTRNGSFVC